MINIRMPQYLSLMPPDNAIWCNKLSIYVIICFCTCVLVNMKIREQLEYNRISLFTSWNQEIIKYDPKIHFWLIIISELFMCITDTFSKFTQNLGPKNQDYKTSDWYTNCFVFVYHSWWIKMYIYRDRITHFNTLPSFPISFKACLKHEFFYVWTIGIKLQKKIRLSLCIK